MEGDAAVRYLQIRPVGGNRLMYAAQRALIDRQEQQCAEQRLQRRGPIKALVDDAPAANDVPVAHDDATSADLRHERIEHAAVQVEGRRRAVLPMGSGENRRSFECVVGGPGPGRDVGGGESAA